MYIYMAQYRNYSIYTIYVSMYIYKYTYKIYDGSFAESFHLKSSKIYPNVYRGCVTGS